LTFEIQNYSQIPLFTISFFISIFDVFFFYFTLSNLSKYSKYFCGALFYRLYILSKNSRKFL